MRRMAVLALLLAVTAFPALAQLSVAPVGLVLRAERPVGVIVFSNYGNEPLDVDLELLEWRQENGETRLLPTERALANPGTFSIPPGMSQAVRVGLLKPDVQERESSFRLVVNELRSAASGPAANVTLRVQVTLPIFVATATARPKAQVSLAEQDGLWVLAVSNSGTAHLRILGLRDGRGRTWSVGGYVLAGAARSWPLGPSVAPAAPCLLQSNVGPIDVPCPR